MILDNPQPYWTRVPAAEWFTFDNNKLIFNGDGSVTIPKNVAAYVSNGATFDESNAYIRIVGDTYERYDLLVSCGDYGEWNISNLEIGNNVVIHDGYPYVYFIMPTVSDCKINYIDYVYLSDIPSNPDNGWIRYDMSDINSVKNVLSENANSIVYNDTTGSISTNIIPIENCIIEENGKPPFLRLELNEFKNISDEYFNYIRSKIFLKRNGKFKIVGRTMQLDAFDSETSPIYPNSQEYNVNINMIPYYDEFYWINEQQNFNQDAKVIAMITKDNESSGSIELTANYPYFPVEVTNGSVVQKLSAIDILYIDEYIGQASNKISEIEFNIDFDKAQLGTYIEIKYLDIKANGVSILDKNPIVKYWNNYNHTVRIFNPEGERFGTSLDLYFQIECDGYETSDVIHKELKMIHIDGYQGDYSGGGSGGGLANYAYHNNDNYKKSEARILIPLTNTSFISYKK